MQPGSWFHVTECFGPVLGVMRADDLDHAIELQNATPFGLTGGIHSLDDAEVDRWLDGVQVGNAYVNRGITGAIVQRQPFGGWKRSSVGCGPKAGGPDYVAEMVTATAVGHRWRRRRAVVSRRVDELVLPRATIPTGLRSESNELRYRPLDGVVVRVGADTPDGCARGCARAAAICGTSVVVSDASTETDEALVERRAARLDVERIRLLTAASDTLRAACRRSRHRDRLPSPCRQWPARACVDGCASRRSAGQRTVTAASLP